MSAWTTPQAFAIGASVARLALRKDGIYLCLRCGSDKLKTKNLCSACQAERLLRCRVTSKARHEKNVKLGLCFVCGRKPQPGRKRCRKCLDAILKNQKAYALRCKKAA